MTAANNNRVKFRRRRGGGQWSAVLNDGRTATVTIVSVGDSSAWGIELRINDRPAKWLADTRISLRQRRRIAMEYARALDGQWTP